MASIAAVTDGVATVAAATVVVATATVMAATLVHDPGTTEVALSVARVAETTTTAVQAEPWAALAEITAVEVSAVTPVSAVAEASAVAIAAAGTNS
jgi:hypothetical protein